MSWKSRARRNRHYSQGQIDAELCETPSPPKSVAYLDVDPQAAYNLGFKERKAEMKEEAERQEEKDTDAGFLRDLAERLMGVPVMYGTDQGDVDRLNEIAGRI